MWASNHLTARDDASAAQMHKHGPRAHDDKCLPFEVVAFKLVAADFQAVAMVGMLYLIFHITFFLFWRICCKIIMRSIVLGLTFSVSSQLHNMGLSSLGSTGNAMAG